VTGRSLLPIFKCRTNEYVYLLKAAQKKRKKEQHKNSNIQRGLYINQTSGTPNQQLNTAA